MSEFGKPWPTPPGYEIEHRQIGRQRWVTTIWRPGEREQEATSLAQAPAFMAAQALVAPYTFSPFFAPPQIGLSRFLPLQTGLSGFLSGLFGCI